MLTKIEEHYTTFFGPHTYTRIDNTNEIPVDILVFPPTAERPAYTLATRGLSLKKQETPAGMERFQHVELLAYLPETWEIDFDKPELPSTWACKFLYFAARYIIDKNIFLGDGAVLHTEDTRHPTFFRFPFAVLTYPLMESPELFPFTVEGQHIELLSPVFITQAEADFGKANGATALIKVMVEKETFESVVQPLRSCTFEGDPSQQVSTPTPNPKERPRSDFTSKKSTTSDATTIRQAARREKEIAEVAQDAQKKGCVISTIVFLAISFLVGSDWWDKTMPGGSGIVLWLSALIVGLLAPFRYAKHKARQFSEQ